MKILSFYAYYAPEFVASLFLQEDILEGFAKADNEVVCHIPIPSRGVTSEVHNSYKTAKDEILHNGHLKLKRYNLIQEGKNPIVRALRYFFQNYKQYRMGIKEKDVDLIFCGSTPPTQGLVVGYIKRHLCKKTGRYMPFVYNLQDIFPDSLVGTGLAKKDGFLWRIGRWIENKTYENADKIIVISQDFKRNLVEKGVPPDKIEVVYNWVNADSVVPVKKENNKLFDEFGIEKNKFTVVYAGNLGNAQNVFLIIDAAKRLKYNKDIQFVIFGSQGVEAELRERIVNEKLDNVKLLPLQPYERVSSVYSLGDVCIVVCKAGLGGSAMPSKTWSIMSTATPVVASFDEGELKDILEKNNCGIFSHAGNVTEFVEAIKSLANNPEQCSEMGKNARQFILNNLTKEVGVKRYVEIIREEANNHKG